jgi:glycerophosphoryl diester phosphodiesterase
MSPLNIAHRGGAGLWPENTLAAFEEAVRLGADGAELDVQLTRDGEVVVFHDNRLKADLVRDEQDEWLDAPGPRVLDLTIEQLERYDVGRPRPGSAYDNAHPDLTAKDGEKIPRLADVIAVAARAPKPFRLFVELKTSFADRSLSAPPEKLAEATLAVLKKANYFDRTVLVGFDWPGLLHAKKIAPDVKCWFTTLAQSWFRDGTPPPEDDPPSEPALKALRYWAETGTSPWAGGFDAVRYGGSIIEAMKVAGADGWFPFYRDAESALFDEAKKRGLKVGAWTVNEAADMRALMQLDALCTDRPDVLKGVLGTT